MTDLYNRIENLCSENDVNITQMCRESGASRASLSDLKMGRKQNLSSTTLSKIAAYFDVTVDYLLGNEEPTEPPVLYQQLSSLCAQKGITGYRLAKDNQLSASLMTDLKMGRKKGVSAEVANKLANYFDVSVDYLLGHEEQKEKPAPTNGDGLSPEDAHIMDMIRQLTPENKRKFAEKLEVLLEFQEPSPDSQA